MTKAAKSAGKPAAKPKGAAKTPVVRGDAAKQKQIDDNPETACYEVLEPFKFRGQILKPPMLIELSAAEAQQYWDAEVLGTDPHDVPDPNSSEQSGGQDGSTNANGATDSA